MKKGYSVLLVSFLLSSAVSAQSTQKDMNDSWGDKSSKLSENKQETKEWFRESKYAMFIHWGLYSQVAGKWNDETFYGIGEWIMKQKKISVADYEKIAEEFNSVKFNAKEWVQLAKDAGMRYIVITAKHHDGFAMFRSSHPYNIVDFSSFGRDPMKDLAEACREEGIGLGFYYSQNQDWHEINSWDSSKKDVEFEPYFENKCKVQVKELLTNYGDIALIWFDTPGNMTKEQSLSLVDITNSLQPKALINSRIGNGVGDYVTFGDHQIPPANIPGLWESINTTNDSWGATWYDKNWKGPEQIAQDLVSVVARGGNYMLNLGPLSDGTMPADISEFLRISGIWVKKHEEAIYGALPSPWKRGFSWGDCTQKGNKLYLFVFDWEPGVSINIYGLKNKISAAVVGGEKIDFIQDDKGWTTFNLPMRKQQELIEVIELEIEESADVDPVLSVDDVSETVLGADFADTKGCKLSHSSWMEKFGEWKHSQNISDWDSESQASWTINVKTSGKYFIDFEYNAFIESSGNEWDVFTENSSVLRFYSLETTGAEKERRARHRFRTVRAGVINIKEAGPQTITVKAASEPKGDGMQLQSLRIVPVK